MCDGGREESMRMCVPIIEKCELDKRCLPTEKLLPLKKKDLEYKEGTKMPTLHNISNDMYTAGMNKLDGKDFHGSYVVDKYMSYELRDRQVDADLILYKNPTIPEEVLEYVER